MRFRKSIKILPGVKINLSGSGISTSVGPKGATINLKPGRKTRFTAGIPGTGLSQSTTIGGNTPGETVVYNDAPRPVWLSIASGTWSVVKLIAIAAAAIVAGILLVFALGDSKKKR